FGLVESVTDGSGGAVQDGQGRWTSAVGNNRWYTGARWDRETGHFHMRARQYEPGTGQFVSRDPLGYVDGPNAYMYGFGNPADWNDPFGLEGDTGFDPNNYEPGRWVFRDRGPGQFGAHFKRPKFAGDRGSPEHAAWGAWQNQVAAESMPSRMRFGRPDKLALMRNSSRVAAIGLGQGEIDMALGTLAAADPRNQMGNMARTLSDPIGEMRKLGGAIGDFGSYLVNEPGELMDMLDKGWENNDSETLGKGMERTAKYAGTVAPVAGGAFKGLSKLLRKGPKVCPPPPPRGLCFVAGTLVLSADGPVKIEEVEAGDWVLAWNFETQMQEYRQVLHPIEREASLTLVLEVVDSSGKTAMMELTAEHPLRTMGGLWKSAQVIELGERLVTVNGECEVVCIMRVPGMQKVYNFEVQGLHCYFVSSVGVLAHNNDCAQPFKSDGQKKGRGRNNLKPDPDASGPHSTWKSNGDGDVTGHSEWQPNPRNPTGWDERKRVDTQYGRSHSHGGVQTPHVHEGGGVRPAGPGELPN
ncbi:MAG: hypothetical protein GY930_20880, partial [bacterium]|nr:hypothetical protein [bacterium]